MRKGAACLDLQVAALQWKSGAETHLQLEATICSSRQRCPVSTSSSSSAAALKPRHGVGKLIRGGSWLLG
jgi:hypothetical protein